MPIVDRITKEGNLFKFESIHSNVNATPES